MNLDLRYWGRSEARTETWGTSLRLSPNLSRPRVFFDAQIADPIKFREGMSALHEVVVGDVGYGKREKNFYRFWKAQQASSDNKLGMEIAKKGKRELEKVPPTDLYLQFKKMHRLYWNAYNKWLGELPKSDFGLSRHLMPCNPIVTIAPDVVFFEGFSKDESSYGSLFIDRDAFCDTSFCGLGTTNIDYSMALFEHFQTLRSYRTVRLQVDPSGFEVKFRGSSEFREENVDVPSSWLRGFGQLQATMGLPCTEITLSVESIYAILVYLKRHKEKTGPQSLRFRLTPGQLPVIILEPWGVPIICQGSSFSGSRVEEFQVWGRRRLFALARLLPWAERIEVRLFGSGMPSVWTVYMKGVRFVLALSGWTTNDWTSSEMLEILSGNYQYDPNIMLSLERHLEQVKKASLADLFKYSGSSRITLLGSLYQLAKQGQTIYDYAASCYRFRPALPSALSESLLGQEPPEVMAGKQLFRNQQVKLGQQTTLPDGRWLLIAHVQGVACEAIVDRDGRLCKAICGCSFFKKFRLHKGPCRHLIAVRFASNDLIAPAWLPAPALDTNSNGPFLSTKLCDWRLEIQRAVFDDLEREALRLGTNPSKILELAWNMSRSRIKATVSANEINSLLSSDNLILTKDDADKVVRTFHLNESTISQIAIESSRLGLGLGQMLGLIWCSVREGLQKSPTVH